jgi:hypothetical protein
MADTVFYSWQSDSGNSTNRGFIEKALENAINGVLQTELNLDLALDRDTQGVPGAPAIANTILQKIDCAAVFVADVSIINSYERGIEGRRLTSNPNVLFELGYAVAKLGWESIILVHNLASGSIEELPFDIRDRRPLTYTARPDDLDRSDERKRLQRSLQAAISACINARLARQPQVRLFFKPDIERFGVENKGISPIYISRFVYEFPQTVNVNSGQPSDRPPILQVANGGTRDGEQYWRLTLIRTNSGPVPGVPLNWTLPDYIAPGESEVFHYPPAFIKGDPPSDARIVLKLYLDNGTIVTGNPTMAELFDPVGPYAPSQNKA